MHTSILYGLSRPTSLLAIGLMLVILVMILPVPAWVMLGIWFGLQFVSGVSADLNAGGVAYWAHAGGFINP